MHRIIESPGSLSRTKQGVGPSSGSCPASSPASSSGPSSNVSLGLTSPSGSTSGSTVGTVGSVMGFSGGMAQHRDSDSGSGETPQESRTDSEEASERDEQATWLQASLGDAWQRVRARLRSEYGEAAWKQNFSPLLNPRLEANRLILDCGRHQDGPWIVRQYGDRVLHICRGEGISAETVEIVASSQATQQGSAGLRPVPAPSARAAYGSDGSYGSYGSQDALARSTIGATSIDAVLSTRSPNESGSTSRTSHELGAVGMTSKDSGSTPRFCFDNYLTSEANLVAYRAAREIAEGTAPFNPLVLHGSVGLGKTHLLKAIEHHCKSVPWVSGEPRREALYLTAEQFVRDFVQALRAGEPGDFKDRLRSVDLLLIDDLHFIIGKEGSEEELFHTFNALLDQGKMAVFAFDRPPNVILEMKEKLRSRLSGGLVAGIAAPGHELRKRILLDRADRMQIPLSDVVADYVADSVSSNVRELEGALYRISMEWNLKQVQLDVSGVEAALRDLLRPKKRRLHIDEIQKVVANHFGIDPREMRSQRRSRDVALTRQVAMYLAKRLTERSLPEIGRRFGNRDHTTVMYAIRKIEERCISSHDFRAEIEEISQRILS